MGASQAATKRGVHLNAVRHGFRAQTIAGRSDVPGYVRQKDDFFPTPERATLALLAVEKFHGAIWEPACGNGAISKVLAAEGYAVESTDLVNRGFGLTPVDFLMEHKSLAPNIVTNPPFKLAVPFVRQALNLATGKVAMLLKIAFLEGVERAEVFKKSPLARVLVFSRRLSFVGPNRKSSLEGSGMMAFAWFVWDHRHSGAPTIGWLP